MKCSAILVLAAASTFSALAYASAGPGVSISGQYTGSKWSISGHIGASTSHLMPPGWGDRSRCGTGQRTVFWNGRYWTSPYESYSSPYASSYRGFMQPIDTTVPRLNPQLLPGSGSPTVDPNKPAPQPPAPPPTTVERARTAAKAKNFADAIKLFKEHLKTSADDALTSRQLAATLIESKDIDSGVALLRELYRKDPTLAEKPYAGADCGQDSSRLREMVGRLSGQAHKTGSPSLWLGVIVMMQADGRSAQAAKILDKAKTAGLESDIVTRFAAVFNPPKLKPTPNAPTAPGATPASPANPAATPTAPSSTPAPTPGPSPTPGETRAPEKSPAEKPDSKPESDKGVSK